ncbi:hypothetical protein GCM10011382_02820 [Vreelandella lutescens]|uniref:Uncharacterized protein n=1 Tax=Vreelandella lutescens TaxID=1602943 RepID=A0ABQ1NGE2_9GAMM|nr:hypothetical protein GCM10011382_02820 [Halomonas lutescens]
MNRNAARGCHRAFGQFWAVFIKHAWGEAGIHYPDKLRNGPVETGLTGEQVAGERIDNAFHRCETDLAFM